MGKQGGNDWSHVDGVDPAAKTQSSQTYSTCKSMIADLLQLLSVRTGKQAEALRAAIVSPAAADSLTSDGSRPDGQPDTLSAVLACSKGRTVEMTTGDSLAVLGCQQQPWGGGSSATSFLLLRCRPQAVVSPAQVCLHLLVKMAS
jgi:hypothetical protein